jgi:hypothetical protein
MGWIVSPVRRGCSTSRFRGSFVVLLAIHGPSPCDVFDTYQTRLQFQPPRDVGKVALPHPRPRHPGTVAADRLRIRSGAVLCAPRLSASITEFSWWTTTRAAARLLSFSPRQRGCNDLIRNASSVPLSCLVDKDLGCKAAATHMNYEWWIKPPEGVSRFDTSQAVRGHVSRWIPDFGAYRRQPRRWPTSTTKRGIEVPLSTFECRR